MPKKKFKKRKFIRPKAGLKPSGPVNQLTDTGGVRYHKGYVYDQLRHTILTIDLMSKIDRDFAEATIKTIVSGPEALTIADKPNWSCIQLDQRGRAYVVAYKGIEVAVFYKRQLTEIKLQPGDTFPEAVLQDPIDAWQRLDLLGQSAKRANFVLTSTLKSLQEENVLLKAQVKTLQELTDRLETQNHMKEMKEAKQVKPRIAKKIKNRKEKG